MKWWDKIINYEILYNELNFYKKKCEDLEDALYEQWKYYSKRIDSIKKVDCPIEEGDYFSFKPDYGTHGYAGRVQLDDNGNLEVVDPHYSKPIKLECKTFRPYAFGVGGDWELIKKKDNQVWNKYTMMTSEG